MNREIKRHSHYRKPFYGYEIRVAVHLDETSPEDYRCTQVANKADGTAHLSGGIPDQAALLGALLHLNDLGVMILSVTMIRRRR